MASAAAMMCASACMPLALPNARLCLQVLTHGQSMSLGMNLISRSLSTGDGSSTTSWMLSYTSPSHLSMKE